MLALYAVPLSLGKRTRVTCVDVSASLLVLGTSAGSVYFYGRPSAFPPLPLSSLSPPLESALTSRALSLSPPSFLRLVTLDLPPASSSLTHVVLSPHHPHTVAVTSVSCLLLLHCNASSPSVAHRVLLSVALSSPPTALAFLPDDSARRVVLFHGGESGAVHRTAQSIQGVLQRGATDVVAQLDGALVQLTSASPYLLLSTTTRSYVWREGRPWPVGSKPRAAAYTMCVDPSTPSVPPTLLCSRPGRRLWKADCAGTVLSTLILRPPPPSALTPLASLTPLPLPPSFAAASLNFTHLVPLGPCVASFTPLAPHLAVLDVGRVEVSDWFLSFGRVLHVAAEGRDCFVLHDREDGAEAELSVVRTSSPYSHLQRLLDDPNTASADVDALLLTAAKYRVYDRGLLTGLQRLVDRRRASGAAASDADAERGFEALLIEAERVERTGQREDWWDDERRTETDASNSAPNSAPSAAAPRAPSSPKRSLLGRTTALLSEASAKALSSRAAEWGAALSLPSAPITRVNPFLLSAPPPVGAGSAHVSSPALTSTAPGPLGQALSPVSAASASPPTPSTALSPSEPTVAFSTAALLPADNLPFAEPQLEEGLEEAAPHQRGSSSSGSDRRKRRTLVDVNGEAAEHASRAERERERERKRRERADADRRRRDRERERALAPGLQQPPSMVLPAPPAEEKVAGHEQREPQPTTESSPSAQPREETHEDTAAAFAEQGGTESAGEGAGNDEDEMDDDVSSMLRPSTVSLLSALVDAAQAPLRSLVRSLRWTYATALIHLRTLPTSFVPVEGEDSDALRPLRWAAAQLRTIHAVPMGAMSLNQLVSDWEDELDGRLQTAGLSGSGRAERLQQLHALLLPLHPLLMRELSALLELHLHLLLLQPTVEEDTLVSFVVRGRALLDPLRVFSFLRLYRHPLALRPRQLFALPEVAGDDDGGAEEPLRLLAALPALLRAPSNSLAARVAAAFPHVEPWMLVELMGIGSCLEGPSLSAVVAVDDARLEWYRAYLSALLHTASATPALQAARRDHRLWRQWVYLTLRLGLSSSTSKGSPPPGRSSMTQVYTELLSFACRLALEETAQAYRKFSFWPGLVAVQRRMLVQSPSLGLFSEALTLALALDDEQSVLLLLSLLSSSSLALPTRLSYAEAVLSACASLERRPASSISFAQVLHALQLALGPPVLLHLLLALPASSPLLPLIFPSFPSSLLAHSQALFALSRSSLAVLETVDSALWSERVDAIGPQLRALALRDMERGWIKRLKGEWLGAGGSRRHEVGRGPQWSRWAEDGGGSSWGRRLRTDGLACGGCGVAVECGERGWRAEDEVLVGFECEAGHLFHRSCLPELACTLCLEASLMRTTSVSLSIRSTSSNSA